MVVLVNGSLRERSTQAAIDFVAATRARLRMEHDRHGDAASQLRSYQELERSISREELARLWPHADVDLALGQASRVLRPAS